MFKVISKNKNKVITVVYAVRKNEALKTEFFIWSGTDWLWVDSNLFTLLE